MWQHGKKAYVAFLDVHKAFDTVWHEGLLVKMFNKGIKGHLWHVINNRYFASSSSALWNSQQSHPFDIKPGGAPIARRYPSNFLYCLFVDKPLTESGLGAYVGNLFCGAPKYADDFSLVASSPAELQAMLDIVAAYAYAHKWIYQINNTKSVILVFRQTSKSRAAARQSRKWFVGKSQIRKVDNNTTWVS